MDRNIMGALTGLDAFVAVRFSENELLKTKVKKATVESKSQRCTAEWNVQIWLPVMMPTMSNVIQLSVWDDDFKVGKVGSDEVVATAPGCMERSTPLPTGCVPPDVGLRTGWRGERSCRCTQTSTEGLDRILNCAGSNGMGQLISRR